VLVVTGEGLNLIEHDNSVDRNCAVVDLVSTVELFACILDEHVLDRARKNIGSHTRVAEIKQDDVRTDLDHGFTTSRIFQR
jgi:hypothetical protein